MHLSTTTHFIKLKRRTQTYPLDTPNVPRKPLSIELDAMAIEQTRTSKAILAVNGFAADGNNFVKRVKQRLEVSPGGVFLSVSLSF